MITDIDKVCYGTSLDTVSLDETKNSFSAPNPFPLQLGLHPTLSLGEKCRSHSTSTSRCHRMLYDFSNDLYTILAAIVHILLLLLLSMRLLHTKTRQFGEFFDSQIPQYAILSHRWGDREVSFKEMRKGTAPHESGMAKIDNFCRLAATRGFDWAWIDTCCIDKRSSAELSEAINAMFKWYERSGQCYVHLSDVAYSPDELQLIRERKDDARLFEDGSPLSAKFRKSSWFTRGWTLQELLAPQKSNVLFFDANWNVIGSLPQLASDVSEITGIEEYYMGFKQSSHPTRWLASFTPSAEASVAKRMSWASRRQTSREEDMAYCLLGLFDVSMSLLYGEGAKSAFSRLQIEIMKTMDDESLFAWTSNQEISGMLAASPSFFADSGDISRGVQSARGPFSMTNKGVEFPVPIWHGGKEGTACPVFVFLNCYRDGKEKVPLALRLQQVGRCGAFRERCDNIDAVGLSPDLEMWTLDVLYEDLQEDTRSVYVFDPYDGIFQTRLAHYIEEYELEEKRRLIQEVLDKAAQSS